MTILLYICVKGDALANASPFFVIAGIKGKAYLYICVFLAIFAMIFGKNNY